ncbi:4-vinyl reductase 4VR [Methanocaldococcus sp. FS406-22]|uniref:V4R domain-containing protein n=1 Tax=Methanocaldococcus sp. (strain FS406-22) TaxID=644281 RepID=UPI0001BF5031|nr:V4R domain-containing protein [Methanocaldococcus sp. FS406-22]ADC70106.1 4-vinyl reductase 4VR [Methanocaldococcus sp. FS406-22]
MKVELKARGIEELSKIFCEGDFIITDDSELINEAVEYLKKEFNEDKKEKRKYIPLELFKAVVFIMMKKIKELDSEITLYDIGYEFGKHLNPKKYTDLKKFFKRNNLGILKIESRKPLILKVENCAFCEDLNFDEPICYFDAGLIAGAFECILEKPVVVDEIKCMAKGDDACYFKVEVVK